MTSESTLTHKLSGSESDLLAFASVWKWERFVVETLPSVLESDEIDSVYQPIFELTAEGPILRAYEAFARFPCSPSIPVGMWFHMARRLGLEAQLERAAGRAAARGAVQLEKDCVLFVNTSLRGAVEMIEDLRFDVIRPVAVDIPFQQFARDLPRTTVDQLAEHGVQVAFDDVPLSDLHLLRGLLSEFLPHYVKVDMLLGMSETPMGSFNLADAASWCADYGITLIAERVETAVDLAMLHDLGADWAQGYFLAAPEYQDLPPAA